MPFIDRYKALIITLLLSGIVVFAMFSIHITKKAAFIAESLYEIVPKTEEELKEDLEKELQKAFEDKSKIIDKAFNEDQEFKDLMKNFKALNSNNLEDKTEITETSETTEIVEQTITNANSTSENGYGLKQSETETYQKLKDLLAQKANAKHTIANHAKGGSTLTYSLKDRTLLSYKTPRYLCERNGKIVVNVRVNQNGDVFEAYINGASNSDNQCLHDHALEYAKSVRFNNSNRSDQLGSITFYFKGKN
jgi:hypothetical protein